MMVAALQGVPGKVWMLQAKMEPLEEPSTNILRRSSAFLLGSRLLDPKR